MRSDSVSLACGEPLDVMRLGINIELDEDKSQRGPTITLKALETQRLFLMKSYDTMHDVLKCAYSVLFLVTKMPSDEQKLIEFYNNPVPTDINL